MNYKMQWVTESSMWKFWRQKYKIDNQNLKKKKKTVFELNQKNFVMYPTSIPLTAQTNTVHQRVNSFLCAPSGKTPCRIGQLIIIVCVKKEVQ